MEFEDNKPVSDEDRRLAEAKKLTLQPVHANIAPESISDSEIANRHVTEPAISNIASDTEQAAPQVMPTKSLLDTQTDRQPQAGKLKIGVAIGIFAFLSLATFALLK